jgi:hypothetical protein
VVSAFRPTIEMTPRAERLAAVLAGLGERAVDLRMPFAQIIVDIRRAEAEQFVSGGAASGEPWAQLSAAYAAAKARAFPGRGPLVRTGRLIAALTGRSSEFQVRTSPRELVVTVADPVWAIQQHGTRHLPARRVVPDARTARRRWVDILSAHLADIARDAAARAKS